MGYMGVILLTIWGSDLPKLGAGARPRPGPFGFQRSGGCGVGSSEIHASMYVYTHVRIYTYIYIWGFPKIMGTFLGVPITRIIVYLGPSWGPLILGTYHIYIYIYRHTYTHIYLKGCRNCDEFLGTPSIMGRIVSD